MSQSTASTLRDYLVQAAAESPETVAFRWKQDGVWHVLTFR